jgi:hypothetical protein
MQKRSTQTIRDRGQDARLKGSSGTNDVCHQLWLIYAQLKDAESDPDRRLELLQRSREELGQAVNAMNRSRSQQEGCANAAAGQV